jgi:hypothetical protein
VSPIALSDEQLDAVIAACGPLAVEDRDAFLQAIGEDLSASFPPPTPSERIHRGLARRLIAVRRHSNLAGSNSFRGFKVSVRLSNSLIRLMRPSIQFRILLFGEPSL